MGEPNYFYNPDDWEVTYPWDLRHDFAEDADMRAGDVMRVATLIEGPPKFLAKVIVTRDEAGDPDEIALRWFDTEAEAKAASAPITAISE